MSSWHTTYENDERGMAALVAPQRRVTAAVMPIDAGTPLMVKTMFNESITLPSPIDTSPCIDAVRDSSQRDATPTRSGGSNSAAERTERRYILAANDNYPGTDRVAVLVFEAAPKRDEIEVMDALISSIELLVANDP